MVKRTDLRKGRYVYYRNSEYFTSGSGRKFKLIKEVDKPISFIPGCSSETDDNELNCMVYVWCKWMMEDENGDKSVRLITAKLGKWNTVYKTYFKIVNFEIEQEEDVLPDFI